MHMCALAVLGGEDLAVLARDDTAAVLGAAAGLIVAWEPGLPEQVVPVVVDEAADVNRAVVLGVVAGHERRLRGREAIGGVAVRLYRRPCEALFSVHRAAHGEHAALVHARGHALALEQTHEADIYM